MTDPQLPNEVPLRTSTSHSSHTTKIFPAQQRPDPLHQVSSTPSTPFAFSAFFPESFFVGFSWGPTDEALHDAPLETPPAPSPVTLHTRNALHSLHNSSTSNTTGD